MTLLDLHTHRPAPYPAGVVSLRQGGDALLARQCYSLGVHPWDVAADPDALSLRLGELEAQACSPQVVAIGEAGLDAMRGGAMWLQLQAFRAQAELAERLGKPLIIHNVKCSDSIVALHKELRPAVRWVMHGFRGKPQVAEMLLRRGIDLSFGEHFNPEALAVVPLDRLYAETDETPLPITEIIARLSESRGLDLLPAIAANTARLLTPPI